MFMRKGSLIVLAASTVLLLLSLALVPATAHSERLRVVATTTVIASVVEDLAGDLVAVEYIAMPSVCPAHYDVKPSDVEKLARASLVLAHGIEPWVDKLVSASGSTAPVVKGVCKSWSTPDALKQCYTQVAEALKSYLNLSVGERLSRSLQAIDSVSSWLKSFSKDSGFEGVPVVVMKWQKPFVSYLGFRVVAEYGPPETVSFKEFSDVVNNASKARALLVIDNMPSGIELGVKIATEIGAVEVALHNFPKAALEISNVTDMWVYNAKLLASALKAANTSRTLEALQSQVLELRNRVSSLTTYLTTSIALNIILAVGLVMLATRLRGVKK